MGLIIILFLGKVSYIWWWSIINDFILFLFKKSIESIELEPQSKKINSLGFFFNNFSNILGLGP